MSLPHLVDLFQLTPCRSFESSGRDRNSYYHPLFLRGLPHLCKAMKRPGVAKKLAADPGKHAQAFLF
jgi:hypothetical protein